MLDSMANLNETQNFEAIEAICKYKILSQFGSSYSWQSLEEIAYYDYSLILIMMESEAKQIREKTDSTSKRKHHQNKFYFSSEDDYKKDGL